jgi:hypothetical protein
MELTNDVIASLSKQCKKDKKLAAMIARDLLSKAEPIRVARLIFNVKIAQELLVQHVQANLAHTVAALTEDEEPKKRGRPVVKIAGNGKKASTSGSGSRHRMSEDEVSGLKKAVCSFLRRKPGSSRAAVQAAVKFPGLAAYNRIMKELVKAKAIKQKGQRRMAVYMAV